MNTSAPEGKGAFPVKLLLCPKALPSQELLAASSWPGCVKALGVSRREHWPRLYPWVNQGQVALLWTEIMVLKGRSDKRELANASVPQSSPEVPPEAVTTRHSCVETKCTSWVLLGIAPVLDLSMVQRGKLSRSSNTPLLSAELYKHQSEHFHVRFSHLFFKASYAELEWQILLFLQCFLPSLFQ